LASFVAGLSRASISVASREDLFPLPVDVSNLIAQKAHVRPSAQRDAVYAF
jgi:hypothetical protein